MTGDIDYDRMEAEEMAADRAYDDARDRTLEEVMKRLKEERAKMVKGDRYTLANVYGINNAIDLVAKMMKEHRDG